MKQDMGNHQKQSAEREKKPINGGKTSSGAVKKEAAAAKAAREAKADKKVIRLDAGEFIDKKRAHSYLKKVLGFPDYYGNNLDALYDCLGELDRAVMIELPQVIQDEDHLSEYGKTMLRVFQDAAAGNGRLEICLK